MVRRPGSAQLFLRVVAAAVWLTTVTATATVLRSDQPWPHTRCKETKMHYAQSLIFKSNFGSSSLSKPSQRTIDDARDLALYNAVANRRDPSSVDVYTNQVHVCFFDQPAPSSVGCVEHARYSVSDEMYVLRSSTPINLLNQPFELPRTLYDKIRLTEFDYIRIINNIANGTRNKLKYQLTNGTVETLDGYAFVQKYLLPVLTVNHVHPKDGAQLQHNSDILDYDRYNILFNRICPDNETGAGNTLFQRVESDLVKTIFELIYNRLSLALETMPFVEAMNINDIPQNRHMCCVYSAVKDDVYN